MRKQQLFSSTIILLLLLSCQSKQKAPAPELIAAMNLKTGQLITCGPPDQEFGKVTFEMSCDPKLKDEFNLAMAMLHSFEYDESEKQFAQIIEQSPDCPMAYWGVAMSNFHPLWSPPTQEELKKGAKAVEIAKSFDNKSARETDYIDAIAAFYTNWDKTDHLTRTAGFMKAMENVYKKYPDDKEAAILYALSLDAAAKPTDKTYANQLKAGEILNSLYPGRPDHPGIVHYIIHTYDYPSLAPRALDAARKYASVAPSSAHALHMPSHIFTRMGLWDEAIASNRASVASAICYAQSSGIKGHWDEELHGLDYLVYAYLQKRNNDSAKAQLRYLQSFEEVNPVNFKVAYAFAAIPARIALENKDWTAAANLEVHAPKFSWNDFPWQESIIHYTKALGYIHLNKLPEAKKEIERMEELQKKLLSQKDEYRAKQVEVQAITANAWLAFQSGEKEKGLTLMRAAADLEDKVEKHPVTPGEVLPARELLADMLGAMNQQKEALKEYSAVLNKSPNRYNSMAALDNLNSKGKL